MCLRLRINNITLCTKQTHIICNGNLLLIYIKCTHTIYTLDNIHLIYIKCTHINRNRPLICIVIYRIYFLFTLEPAEYIMDVYLWPAIKSAEYIMSVYLWPAFKSVGCIMKIYLWHTLESIENIKKNILLICIGQPYRIYKWRYASDLCREIYIIYIW